MTKWERQERQSAKRKKVFEADYRARIEGAKVDARKQLDEMHAKVIAAEGQVRNERHRADSTMREVSERLIEERKELLFRLERIGALIALIGVHQI